MKKQQQDFPDTSTPHLQRGSSLAWTLVILLAISSSIGWFFYLQEGERLENNRKLKQQLEQRYAQKNNELYHSLDKVQNLIHKNYQLKHEIKNFQGNNKKLHGEINQLSVTNKELRASLSEYKDESVITQQKAEQKDKQINEYSTASKKSITQLKQLLKQKKHLAKELDFYTQQVKKQERKLIEKDALIKKLRKQSQQLSELEDKKYSQKNTLMTQCHSNLASQKLKFAECSKHLNTATKNADIEKQLLKSKIDENEISLNTSLKNISRAKNEINHLKKQLTTLKHKNNAINVHFEDTKNSLEKYQNKLTEDLIHTKLQVKNCQQELQTNTNNTTALDKLTLNYLKDKKKLTENYQKLHKKYQTRDKQLHSCLIKFEQLNSANKKISDINKQINLDINKLTENHAKLENKLSKTQTGNKYLARQLQRIDRLNKKELKAFNHLREKLKSEINNKNITIAKQKDHSTHIKVGNDLMFKPGQIYISPKGTHILDEIAQLLKGFPNRKIEIIGHTDDIPVRSGTQKSILSNWELSAARAGAAIRYLQHASKIDPQRMLLVGASQYQPIQKGNTDSVRAQNRRIEIRLLPEKNGVNQ